MPRTLRIRLARRRMQWEVVLVLGLSLLPSSLYAIIALLETALEYASLGAGQQQINSVTSAIPVIDALRRLTGTLADLAPVALVIWLLWTFRESGLQRLGIDWQGAPRLVSDTGRGLALAAMIGLPGLALYAVSRLVQLTPQVVTAPGVITGAQVFVLLLAALRAALIEEIVVVGYLGIRLRTLGWSTALIIITSALIRGSYHLYQGPVMALGNVVMGALFAWLYLRGGAGRAGGRPRVAPFIIAHFVLDSVAFLGYPIAVQLFPQIF